MLSKYLLSTIALSSHVAATGLRDTIAEKADLSIFKDLVDQYNVWKPFSTMDNITVLAPNNAAYEMLALIGLNLSSMGADFTVPILKYHFLEGAYDAESFPAGNHAKLVHTSLTGLNQTAGAPVSLYRTGNDRSVEGGLQLPAGVIEMNIPFDGGLLHVLNSTLVAPHNISATAFMNQLNEFLAVMDSSNMVGTMEDLYDSTIFLPNDAAWMKYKSLLALMTPAQVAKILGYHAVKGKVLYQHTISEKEQMYETLEGGSITVKTNAVGNILVNGVPVVKENLVWYGGVAHIISDVLIPGSYPRIFLNVWETDSEQEPGTATVQSGAVESQAIVASTRSIMLYAKESPFTTAGILFVGFVLACVLVLSLVRQHRSKFATVPMRLVMEERLGLPQKMTY